MSILIIDFHYSFNRNIASELYELNLKYKILSVDDPGLSNYLDQGKFKVLLWGPGPGGPDEYLKKYKFLKKHILREDIFHFGICLGHQLILCTRGAKVKRSARPIHGQSFPLNLEPWADYFDLRKSEMIHTVQRYNSLIVDTEGLSRENMDFLFHEGECVAAKGKNFLGLQFHPESVGTSCPKVFFGSVRKITYNKSNEPSALEARRSL
jgi:anthranilate/para-aminobenzoate synthase component II